MSEKKLKSGRLERVAGEALPRFFSTPELTQRLDLIRHLTDNSERILVIRGPEGAGKTTVLQRFYQLAREEWLFCHVDANTMLQPDQLFSLLSDCMEVPGENQTLDHLIEKFEATQSQGQLVVIVIDDAHLLPTETLIALFRLHERCTAGKQALAKILLFASPVIDEQFNMLQIKAMNLQVLQMLDIPLFNRDQTTTFIAFLLGRAGSLRRSRIERVFKQTGGLPGAIEAQLQSEVISADSDHQPTFAWRSIFADLPGPALVGGGVLGLLILLTLLFQDEINVLFEGGVTEQVDTLPHHSIDQEPVVALKLPGLAPVVSSEVEGGESETVSAAADNEGMHSGEVVAVETPTEIIVDAPVSEMLPDPAEQPGSSGEVVVQESSPPEPESTQEPAVPPIKNASAIADETEKSNSQVPVEERSTDMRVTVAETKKTPVVQVEAQQPAKVTEAGYNREEWLLSQDPAAYTLQLIGLRDERAAQEFIKRHKLTGRAAYFKTELGSKPWYSVVYGLFSDRKAAVKAEAELPKAVRRNNPWPRAFASVQESIKGR